MTTYVSDVSGNDAENTNHSWEEINSYSVFDYEEMMQGIRQQPTGVETKTAPARERLDTAEMH